MYIEITEPSIALGPINGTTFKVGEKILVKTRKIPFGSKTKTIASRSFHGFTLSDKAGVSGGISYKTIAANYLKNDEGGLDMYIVLSFNDADQLISILVGG